MRACSICFFVAGLIHVAAAQEFSWSERYDLAPPETANEQGLAWETGPQHIWSLERVEITHGENWRLTSGRAKLILGVSDNVPVWALLLPDKPANLSAADPADAQDMGIPHAWLRFHPQQLPSLFPPDTVTGPAPANSDDVLFLARRIANWKLGNSFHIGNRCTIPPMEQIVVDVDTARRSRWFYLIDRRTPAVRFIPAFLRRPVRPPLDLTREQALAAFDEVWDAFDREYAQFGQKPEVDWQALREQYRPRAADADNNVTLARVLAEMLAPLEDLHVSVRIENEYFPVHERTRLQNASWSALDTYVPRTTEYQRVLAAGMAEERIGYIVVGSLQHPEIVKFFDDALRELDDARALIIDLRYNGGGNETLAQGMAGRFVDQPYEYSYSRVRTGPAHSDLSELRPRVVNPRGERIEKPVLVLIGEHTMSSAESFALMLQQAPNVRLYGAPTAGSSGNPRALELAGDIAVTVPRWLDYTAEKTPLEDGGVQPEIVALWEREEFTPTRDPVLEGALRLLNNELGPVEDEPARLPDAPAMPGMSGIARLSGTHLLTAHDRKPDEAGGYLGVINLEPGKPLTYEPLTIDWGERDAPRDLEALDRIRRLPGQFLVAESGYRDGKYGRIFHLQLRLQDRTFSGEVLHVWQLPKDIAQLEGLAFVGPTNDGFRVVLGERGGSKECPQGRLRIAVLPRDSGEIRVESTLTFAAPDWPADAMNRDISDLTIDRARNLWVAATDDPGDDGPFRSRLYNLGPVSERGINIPADLQAAYTLDGLKVEALMPGLRSKAPISIGTDDENYGGIWRPLPAPE